jgi:type IV secretory pathway TrbD component
VDTETRSVMARGVKGKVAAGISTVVWIVIFLVALWIATEPRPGLFDPGSSLRSTFTAIVVLSLWGWLVSTFGLFLLFTAGDWIRHRLMRK